MQLRIAALALVAWTGLARAQAPGDTPKSGDTPTSDDTPKSGDTPTSDDYRDVLGGERAQTPTEPEQPASSSSDDDPATGTGRLGVYHDTDKTTVLRALATVVKDFGHWGFTGGVTVDAVTSASIDVRTSPALGRVDVVTSASGRSSTSGGEMSDTRYLATGGMGWKDTSGHAINISTAAATERDYQSVSGGLNGSYDIDDRNMTLLGGFVLTDNWVSSVLDSSLHQKMISAAWTAGVARVLTPSDALRVRYDGKHESGDLASPYRNVRFGNWTTHTLAGGQLMFDNTIGSGDGLPEQLPTHRTSHALAFEWVHALGLGVGLHPAVRVGYNSWGIASVTPSLELRVARKGWRLQAGYRYYQQSRASFFAGKYTEDPSMYTYYTSDKELGSQVGHLGSIDLAEVIREPASPSETRMLLFIHADVFHYAYPGFDLLPSRTSTFLEAGLSWEL